MDLAALLSKDFVQGPVGQPLFCRNATSMQALKSRPLWARTVCILEIRPYAQGDCNGSTDPDLTTKRGQRLKPVVHFWPKAFAIGGACSKYLEDHRDEIGGILPDEDHDRK